VTYLTPAERLLQKLGITEPEEIDLEAIAFHLGACVRFRKLDGCEARIIGRNDQAIITIGEDCSYRRKRFPWPTRSVTGPITKVRRSSAA
jgi:hypothetical protein